MRLKITGTVTMERLLKIIHDLYSRLPDGIDVQNVNIYLNFQVRDTGRAWYFLTNGKKLELVEYQPEEEKGIPVAPPAPEPEEPGILPDPVIKKTLH
ncbi:hypothetical protein GALL_244940 [mine drainage metagenome]|uniref:Uncharacterized protein n=1 Tax=mine drainage metagenome TaxID=410659 RepID=A0A1J5RBT4_9ZZZZ